MCLVKLVLVNFSQTGFGKVRRTFFVRRRRVSRLQHKLQQFSFIGSFRNSTWIAWVVVEEGGLLQLSRGGTSLLVPLRTRT